MIESQKAHVRLALSALEKEFRYLASVRESQGASESEARKRFKGGSGKLADVADIVLERELTAKASMYLVGAIDALLDVLNEVRE